MKILLTKRMLKRLGWTLGTVILVLFLLFTVVAYVVVTPKRITPIVQRVVDEALDAKIHIEEVDVTFFSSFPRLGIELKEGALVVEDTTQYNRPTKRRFRDSLLTFQQCRVEFEPLALLFKKRLLIQEISLDSARVFAWKNEQGQANWEMIAKASDTSETAKDTLAKTDFLPGIKAVLLRELVVNGARISYMDRTTQTSLMMRNVDAKLRLGLLQRGARMSLDLHCGSVSFRKAKQSWIRRMRMDFKTRLGWDNASQTLRLTDARLGLNELELLLSGTVSKQQDDILLDIDLNADAPSIEKMLAMVPKHIMSQEGLKADGSVHVGGKIQGTLGNGSWPVFTFGLKVEDASARYEGLPYAMDYMTAIFDVYLDRARNDSSFVDLKILQLKGMNTDILLDAKLTEIFTDPLLRMNAKAQVDLEAIAKTFPWSSSIVLSGNVDTDLRIRTRLSTLQNGNYGRIFAVGKLETQNVAIRDTSSAFEVNSQAVFRLIGGKSLGAKAEIAQLNVTTDQLRAKADSLFVNIRSTRPTDTTHFFQVKANATMKRLFVGMADSMRIFCRRGNLQALLASQRIEEGTDRKSLDVSLVTDTLSGRMGDMRAFLRHGGIDLKVNQRNDTIWDPAAVLNFSAMSLKVPQLKVPVRFRQTAITFEKEQLKLDQAQIHVGRSDMTLSGYLNQPYEALKQGEKIQGKLEVDSKEIYVGQLLGMLQAASSDQAQTAEAAESVAQPTTSSPSWSELEKAESQQRASLSLAEAAAEAAMKTDTVAHAMKLLQIPENLEIELLAKVGTLHYGTLSFSELKGRVEVKNKYVYLENLQFGATQGGQVLASMIYQAATPARGYTGFELKLRDVDMGEMIRTIPALDSLVPMLQSFEGIVNLEIAAEGVLDSLMTLNIPSLRAAMNLQGDDLVVLDGDTFAELSDLLMFKNKERNLIDELSVNMTLENGVLTIYPFLLEMDRYQAAAGGTQNLDMSFDYHVSILKSPLPFKSGVNVRGTPEDLRFGITRAKYKNKVTETELRKTDTLRMAYAEEITSHFKSVSERKRWDQRVKKRSRMNWSHRVDSLRRLQAAEIDVDSTDWKIIKQKS